TLSEGEPRSTGSVSEGKQNTEASHAGQIQSPADGSRGRPCRQAWRDEGARAQGRLQEHVRIHVRKGARRTGEHQARKAARSQGRLKRAPMPGGSDNSGRYSGLAAGCMAQTGAPAPFTAPKSLVTVPPVREARQWHFRHWSRTGTR